jgi:hypothetical protein
MKAIILSLAILIAAGCTETIPVVAKRDIKFKGQQLNGTEWFYGRYVSDSCIANNMASYAINPETVSQYTGILDSKGSEIWENDIVQDEYGFGKIIFSAGKFSVQFDKTVILDIDGKYLTVVGNIFDSSNLLVNR